jgi:hypothetical protein
MTLLIVLLEEKLTIFFAFSQQQQFVLFINGYAIGSEG